MFVYMSVNIGQYPWNKDVYNEVHCKKESTKRIWIDYILSLVQHITLETVSVHLEINIY